jgi:hypothetical protein
MFGPARVLGILALGACATLVASAQPGTPANNLGPTVAAVLKLADNLDRADVSAQAKKMVSDLDACEMSRVFGQKTPQRGGVGIGSAVKAGHKDSIEELVQDWSGPKPPTREELKTHRKDLLRVARVMQAMAELAPHRFDLYRPLNNKKWDQDWRQVSAQFKTTSQALHDAIEKVDPAETRQVAVRMQQTCNACHQLARR